MSAWEPARPSGGLVLSRVLGLTLLGAALLVWAGFIPLASKGRVRWTLTVQTPDGPRMTSSVLGIWAHWQPRIGEAPSNLSDVTGEVIGILRRGDYIFAVMEEGQERTVIPKALRGSDTVDSVRRIRRLAGSGRLYEMPEYLYPDLVRFDNRNDSESIRAVCMMQGDWDDRAPPRSCAIRPVRVTVTPTRAWVTDGISKPLPGSTLGMGR